MDAQNAIEYYHRVNEDLLFKNLQKDYFHD